MGLFHNKMTRNSVWQTGIIFFNVQVSYKSYQMCFRHFTFSLSWTPMFRHEWGFMWGSYSGDHTPFPWGKCKWGNPCILAIPNKIIHSCVCVYSSWKQWLDHNQHFLVWCTLLSDKVEQRYSGPLELRPSFFLWKWKKSCNSINMSFFSDFHCNLLWMISESLVLDIMPLQVHVWPICAIFYLSTQEGSWNTRKVQQT